MTRHEDRAELKQELRRAKVVEAAMKNALCWRHAGDGIVEIRMLVDDWNRICSALCESDSGDVG